MDYRKLFQVLVVGGAVAGGAAACGDEAPAARVEDKDPNTAQGDAGTQGNLGDAGSEEPGGGGVPGW